MLRIQRLYSTGSVQSARVVDKLRLAISANHGSKRRRNGPSAHPDKREPREPRGKHEQRDQNHDQNHHRRRSLKPRPSEVHREANNQMLKRSFPNKIDSAELSMEPFEVPGQAAVPGLANNLDRALFSPGVHFLKDPRTNVYNFDSRLEKIMSIRDFDFSAIPAYVPAGKDNKLSLLAQQVGKRYTGSTSSLTGLFTHLHFMISHHRPPQLMGMSKFFSEPTTTFTLAQRSPVSLYLRFNPRTKTFSVNSGGVETEDMVLMLLGQTMETMLVTESGDFKNYDKSHSHLLDESMKNPSSSYNYTQCGPFLMRSQLDCHDPRLPGTGMFDLKTRAVCAIRHDLDYAQIHDGSDYQILKTDGFYESYAREYYELVRSAMFKYSLQARIGRMDGIFVAYHNIKTLFGVQYLPLTEIDKVFHTAHLINSRPESDIDQAMSQVASLIAEKEFQLSVSLASQLFDHILDELPESAQTEAINLVLHSPGPGQLLVFAKPMLDEHVESAHSVEVSQSPHSEVEYETYQDAASLYAHSRSDGSLLPPDVLAVKVSCRSQINGKPVPLYHYPSIASSEDKWELEFDVEKLPPAEAQREFTDAMEKMSEVKLTSSPLTYRPDDEAQVRESALSQLPPASSFQSMLRNLGAKGKAYRDWDEKREKIQWRPTT